MRLTAKLSCLATTIGAVAVLGAASASWACSADAHLNSISPTEAQPGQVIAVEGGQFIGAAELRWETATGPILATAPYGGSFTQNVPLPADASAGPHLIVGVARRADGVSLGHGATGIMIVAPKAGSADSPPAGSGAPPGNGDPGIVAGPPTSSVTINPGVAAQDGGPAPVIPVTPASPPAASSPAPGGTPAPTPGAPLTAVSNRNVGPVNQPAAAVTSGPAAAPLTGALNLTGHRSLPSAAGRPTPGVDLAAAAKVDPWVADPAQPATAATRPASLLDTGHHKTASPLHLSLLLLGIGVPGLFAAAIAYEVLRGTTPVKLHRS